MDYENFKESFTEALQEDLYGKGLEARFDMKSVEKLNNEGYDAVTVTPADSNIGVTLNVEAFYKAHESGASMDEVVSKASDTVIRGFDNQPSIDVASLMDYEQMKDKLIMEVVSTEANADMLTNVPHVEMEDMSVVYRFVIDSNDDGRATILATNNMLEAMGITPEQLHEDALKNAPKLKPAVITGMSEVMAEMMGMSPEEMAMMGMPTDPADEQMFVATVPDKIHGAGVLAYQDFMEQAAERVGGECLGLRWEDVNFKERYISVNHNFVERPDPDHDMKIVSHIQTPKTEAGKRTIPMVDEVFDAFIMEYQIQQCIGFCEEEIDGYSGFIFSTAQGKLYRPGSVNDAIHRCTNKYNRLEKAAAKKEKRDPILLPSFSAHNLRHTFCTRLCENESNLKVIQDIMGHADIKTTMDIYAECTHEKKQEAVSNLQGKIIIK